MKIGSTTIRLEWLALAGLLIYILLLQECNTKPGGLLGPNDTVDTLSYTTDTVRISTIDTVFLPGEPITTVVSIPTPVYIHDTIYQGDTFSLHTFAEYTTDISDSLIKGEVVSKVDGVLVSQELTYTPLFPKYIHQTDTVIIENNTVVDKKRLFLFVGGEVGGSMNAFNLSPVIGLGTRKGYMYSYRYGLLDQTHNITFSKRLSFKLRK
jgi:hypothetical protein